MELIDPHDCGVLPSGSLGPFSLELRSLNCLLLYHVTVEFDAGPSTERTQILSTRSSWNRIRFRADRPNRLTTMERSRECYKQRAPPPQWLDLRLTTIFATR
ncbi:hypothetical protein AG1IA_08646 [Rhizoctonia solani AG-1 IA]|uniref:Uncharacterized protein n=1 Tax=Thanatephorus cucumeris (strain AG1-IA) TaxID=983506 RepID=L8WGN6_THACA|nr:hypothetical protein AG1IA_08646 [Rhizoctonia solani AG-1 IA]